MNRKVYRGDNNRRQNNDLNFKRVEKKNFRRLLVTLPHAELVKPSWNKVNFYDYVEFLKNRYFRQMKRKISSARRQQLKSMDLL